MIRLGCPCFFLEKEIEFFFFLFFSFPTSKIHTGRLAPYGRPCARGSHSPRNGLWIAIRKESSPTNNGPAHPSRSPIYRTSTGLFPCCRLRPVNSPLFLLPTLPRPPLCSNRQRQQMPYLAALSVNRIAPTGYWTIIQRLEHLFLWLVLPMYVCMDGVAAE